MDSPAAILAMIAPIVAKASTLRERLLRITEQNDSSQDDALIAARFERWQEFAARRDPEQFERRLAFDDLSLDRLHDVLGEAHLINYHATGETLPAWAHLLAEAVEAQQEKIEPPGCLSPNDPIPF